MVWFSMTLWSKCGNKDVVQECHHLHNVPNLVCVWTTACAVPMHGTRAAEFAQGGSDLHLHPQKASLHTWRSDHDDLPPSQLDLGLLKSEKRICGARSTEGTSCQIRDQMRNRLKRMSNIEESCDEHSIRGMFMVNL